MELVEKGSEIFDGRQPPESFIEDLNEFLTFDDKLKKEIIKKAILWLPEEQIDEEWKNWVKGKTEEEKNSIKGALRIVVFLIRKSLMKRFSHEELKNELHTLGFKHEMLQLFAREFDKNKEKLIGYLSKQEMPIVGQLVNLYWRIDAKKVDMINRKMDSKCAMVKLVVAESDEKRKEVTFEISKAQIDSLLRTFTIIRDEIIKMEE
jgi:hypothetical protein